MTGNVSATGLQFENEVRRSLKKIGFKDVAGGPDFKVGGHQIDACGGWDDILLVAECRQSGGEGGSIHDLISEVRGKQSAVRQGFRKLKNYEAYRRFEFAIITRNIRYTEGDRDIASHRPVVHLFDFQVIDYYQRLASLIGLGALFNLLGELQIEPRESDLPRVPAFRVRLAKDQPAYLFWCEPHKLLKFAYVARRESGREGYYQRMLNAQRLGKIREFIQKGNIFPNNIIIAFDRRPEFRLKQTYGDGWRQRLEFGELIFPNSYRSCWVIDGQHRLYAFAGLTENFRAQKLAVFAFEPMKEHKQAKFFIDINKEQKPVSLDLIWDLEGEMSPDTPRGRIANCVKTLNSIPPLKGLVYLPLSGERRHGQLKMSGVCQDFQDTGLLNERTRCMTQTQRNPLAHRVNLPDIPDKVARAVADFLNEVQRHSSEALWKAILLRPGGITLALNVYEQVLIRVGQAPSHQQLEKYAKAFVEVLAELAPNQSEMRRLVRQQLTSYAQRRLLCSEVLGKMQGKLGDPEFARNRVPATEPFDDRLKSFERRLAEFVTERLGIATPADLKQKAPEGVWKTVLERFEKERKRDPHLALHEVLTLGETKQIIERSENAKVLMPLFTGPLDGFGDEQAVLAGLTGIINARNATAHGRRVVGNRRLLTAYLETFESLVGSY